MDIARTDLGALSDDDVRFLLDRFPPPAPSYERMAEDALALPDTLETMLSSPWVVERIFDARETVLRISPFLLFNALLRQSLPARPTGVERPVVNYLANVLALFVRAERVFRAAPEDEQAHEYITDLLAEAETAEPRRRFLVHAHVGNHAIYLSGVFSGWLHHRHRYGRRPVTPDWYAQAGAGGYHAAAGHPLAREYGLDGVFLRLAVGFEHYRAALERMARRWLHDGRAAPQRR